ncbi:MAG: YceD family protein [Bradymonadia bacterium]|jgi:uncharacterized protein
MKLQIAQINDRKTTYINGEVSVDDAVAYFESYAGYICESPLSYKLELRRKAKGIALEASVCAHLSANCQRCLTLKSFEVNTQCSLLLVSQDLAPKSEEYGLSADDLDTVYYEGDVIDIDALVLETVLLELDSRVVCDEECRGLCSQCGHNLNLGTCDCKGF